MGVTVEGNYVANSHGCLNIEHRYCNMWLVPLFFWQDVPSEPQQSV